MYRAYKDKLEFLFVYVREAHPEDGRQSKSNIRDNVVYKKPKSLKERAKIANDCIKSLNLTMPFLVDNLDDSVQKKYRGWPARACLVNAEGKIAFISRPGPMGINPSEIEKVLKGFLSKSD